MNPQRQNQHPQPPAVSYNSSFLLLAFTIIAVAFIKFSLHQIPEGHIGVYWRGGKLLPGVSNPGFQMKLPFLDSVAAIQVTIQTDEVRNIPCGTKGGVLIIFEKVEVVNRLKREHVYQIILEYGVNYDKTLIYDKIHHEINQFCSMHDLQQIYIDKFDQVDEILKDALQTDCDKYAPGIEVRAVRLTKPRIPASITANYEDMERKRTAALIAEEHQRVVLKEAETERKRTVMQAEKDAEASRIRMEQVLAEREAEKKQKAIEDEIFVSREKALADAEAYRSMQQAASNKDLLTSEYLQLTFTRAISNITKIYFGEKVPQILTEQWGAMAQFPLKTDVSNARNRT